MIASKLTPANANLPNRRSSGQARAGLQQIKYLIALLGFCFLLFGSQPGGYALPVDEARVSGFTVRKLTTSDDKTKVTLALEIKGNNFGTQTPVTVKLVNLETGTAVDAIVSSHDDNLIMATVQIPLAKKSVKYQFRVTVGGRSAIQPGHLSDYTVEVGKEEKKNETPTPFEITFETFKSEEYPNLHSLVITNKSQDNKAGFSTNPALMKVDIVPAGATNVTIQAGSSPYQMFVTFLGPENFEVKAISVTVFDPDSTLADNQLRAFSTPFKAKEPKAYPNQPTISDIKVLSMQRHSGYGLVRIQGEGFGDYERPPITGEKELLCCLNRPSNPNIADEQVDRRVPKEEGEGYVVKDYEVCRLADTGRCYAMAEWRRQIEERVNVTLMPRNPDFRVERTQIVYIDDKIIDVYFEFTHFEEYSIPFRLENATITVNKGGVKETRTSDEEGSRTAVLSSPQTFVATKDIGPPRDENLEYRYTVLNPKDAIQLFGGGVGQNFFVIELTVVNNGKKKMAVPLGAIQAEAAWRYGDNGKEFFEEGPATLPSLPLGAVSGYFDAYQKSKGKWAKVFNTLEGVATLAATMVPVIHEVERPAFILSTGVVPGLRKAIGDLSSEQLQRLASMSWENVEEIVPGGSKTKFIYIPRADQFFGGMVKRKLQGTDYKLTKRVMDLTGLEVAGFEVTESEKKQATEQEKESPEPQPPQ